MNYIYKFGEKLQMENTDGVQMVGQVLHSIMFSGTRYYLVELDTGLTVSYSQTELDQLVRYSW